MRIQKLIVATHRDLGYFFFGLTVIYAVSGAAVNHMAHWNPNYTKDIRRLEVGPLPEAGERGALADTVLERMHIDEKPRSVVRMPPDGLMIFLEDRTLTVSLPDGVVTDEQVRERPVLYQFNYLHLNRARGAWTYLADAYALALLILAVTGILIIRGKKGLGGRGRWLMAAGIAVPVIALLLAG